MTRLEIGRVMGIAHEIDPAAFIVIHPLSDVKGGVLKKTGPH